MPPQTDAGGLVVALRRVVVGYRVVGLLWLWVLAAVALVTEPQVNAGIILVTGGLATVWTVATVSVAARAPVALRSPVWIALDVVVAAAIIVLAPEAGSQRGFFGGYPFSTVLLAAYGAGYPGAFLAAGVLAAVSLALLGPSEAISSSLVYLAGAGVTVWGFDVLRRNDQQRRALEQRLAAEQAERARSQERADTAAALHDSVLQTLALIQRRSHDPGEVSLLARRQERDLRDWLAGRAGLGGGQGPTLAAALKDAAADVEGAYPVTVEVVTVGDLPVDGAIQAIVAAAREAMVNAAKHAGVPVVAVYAEVDDDAVTVFVRDRGGGFDPAVVPADRRGIAESIVGRMQRAGGTAAIKAAPGSGTEVVLSLPRRAMIDP